MTIDTKYFYFRTNEWHHLYTGIILVVLGILSGVSFTVMAILWTFGWLLIGDDIGQHVMQGVLHNPNYHTPWHYAGKPFYVLRGWLIKKYPECRWLGKL